MPEHSPASAPEKVNTQLEAAIEAILCDQPIAYHPAVAKAVGSVTAGVLLSQLLYWTPRSRDSAGWIWKTQAEIYEETGLTRREQETARRHLVELGIVAERRAGVPAKLYFRVDMRVLARLIAPTKDGGMRHASMAESAILDGRKAPDKRGGKRQTISESTSETTSEITGSSEFRRGSRHKENQGDERTRQPRRGEAPDTSAVADHPASTACAAPGQADGPPPSYIDRVVEDVVEKLTGGSHELASHRTQARTLWETSQLSVQAFANLLYELRDEVRRRRGIDEPMAYFFTCLKVRLGLLPNPNPPDQRPSGAPPAATRHPAATAANADDDGVTDRWVRLPDHTDAARLWQRALARIESQVTQPIFALYLRGTAGTGIGEDGRLIVATPSDFAAEWLGTKLYRLVQQSLEAIEGLSVGVDFRVTDSDDNPPGNMPSEALRGPKTGPKPASGPEG
ncbi:MAG TPA: DnaA N-terminal domain-containing protein [Chloroflexota bacterium]|nr:DnaA N-terminal domain-containing protein [Chloroflexota bacterium]